MIKNKKVKKMFFSSKMGKKIKKNKIKKFIFQVKSDLWNNIKRIQINTDLNEF